MPNEQRPKVGGSRRPAGFVPKSTWSVRPSREQFTKIARAARLRAEKPSVYAVNRAVEAADRDLKDAR